MHEMSLCEGIRNIVEEQARLHNFQTVSLLRLEIGRFAGVQKEAMIFAFDVVMRGSPAEGAVLEIQELPALANCFECGEVVEIVERLDPCPLCQSARLMPISGDEMRIKDMEVH